MGFNPQIWSAKTVNAMERAMKTRKAVIATITDYTKFTEGTQAEAYNGPIIGSASIATLPASSANSPTNTVLNLPFDQKKGVIFNISDIDNAQTNVNLLNEYTANASDTLLDDYDLEVVKTIIGGLTTDGTQRVVLTDSSNLVITEADFIKAKVYLNSVKAPLRGRTCLICPVHESQLYTIANFISRDKIASSEAVPEGVIGRLHGFDILLYNDMPKVNTSGKIDATAGNNVKNCTLFYQSLVCAFARQKAIGTKVADNALLPGATVNIYSVYGRKIQKGAYGYLVYDKAS